MADPTSPERPPDADDVRADTQAEPTAPDAGPGTSDVDPVAGDQESPVDGDAEAAGDAAVPPELLERLGQLGVQLGAAGLADGAGSAAARRARSRGRDVERGGERWSESESGRPDSRHGIAHGDAGGAGAGERPASGRRDQRGSLPTIEQAVPGRTAVNDRGTCYVSVVRRGLDEAHAGERVRDALAACTVSLSELAGDQALADLDVRRTVFLDTETTGLSGGAGTYAFLIGAGRFRGGAFQVRQFFMRHPGEEAAQLGELQRWLAGCDSTVTFNGKSFDLPLLRTRFRMHKMPNPLEEAVHLDLLPAARRVWRRRLSSCRLTSLERHVLGLERVDDVPGWLVPERYRRYQQEGDARPLEGIFRHNALDILAMVSLLTRLARCWQRPAEALDHARDWLSLARAYERANRPERAIEACRLALAGGLARPEDVDEAFERLTMVAKRRGDWPRAVELWRELASATAPRRLYPFEELAKYYEHRAPERDLAAALRWSERGRTLVVERRLRPMRGRRRALEELDHRIARLERRLAR